MDLKSGSVHVCISCRASLGHNYNCQVFASSYGSLIKGMVKDIFLTVAINLHGSKSDNNALNDRQFAAL